MKRMNNALINCFGTNKALIFVSIILIAFSAFLAPLTSLSFIKQTDVVKTILTDYYTNTSEDLLYAYVNKNDALGNYVKEGVNLKTITNNNLYYAGSFYRIVSEKNSTNIIESNCSFNSEKMDFSVVGAYLRSDVPERYCSIDSVVSVSDNGFLDLNSYYTFDDEIYYPLYIGKEFANSILELNGLVNYSDFICDPSFIVSIDYLEKTVKFCIAGVFDNRSGYNNNESFFIKDKYFIVDYRILDLYDGDNIFFKFSSSNNKKMNELFTTIFINEIVNKYSISFFSTTNKEKAQEYQLKYNSFCEYSNSSLPVIFRIILIVCSIVLILCTLIFFYSSVLISRKDHFAIMPLITFGVVCIFLFAYYFIFKYVFIGITLNDYFIPFLCEGSLKCLSCFDVLFVVVSIMIFFISANRKLYLEKDFIEVLI